MREAEKENRPNGSPADAGFAGNGFRAEGDSSAAPSTRRTVMIVDGDADARRRIAGLLERDYRTVTMPDGRAALDAIRRDPPDLVLADATMPRLDGFELPVIILSARAGEEERPEDADDYLIKPFGARELLARVRSALELYETRRLNRQLLRERDERLASAHDALEQKIRALRQANQEVQQARRAALNVMEDAVEVREEAVRTAAALRESEARFRNMADSAPVMIWVTEPDGTCTYLSKSWYEFTGRTEETGLGLDRLDAAHPDDAERAGRVFLAANEKREPFRLEYRVRRGDGEYRWAIDSAKPRISESGEFLGYIGSIIDITERKLAEETIRESRERLQLASDAMKAVVYDWEIEPDRIWRSKELADLIGFEMDDEIATNAWWRSRLHPDDAGRAVEVVDNAINGDAERFDDEYRIRHLDGHYLWVSDRGIFVRDESGRAVRCVGSVRDIAARKATEDALRASELLSRITRLEIETMYQTAPFGMCQLDRELRYTRINDRLAEMNGAPAEKHLGRRLEEMVPGLAHDIADSFRRVMKTGEPVLDIEISGETAAQPGVLRWWRESWFPQRSVGGEIVGVNVVAHEITARKAAEEKLKQSRERFRLAQKAGRVGVWDWDAATGETYWSETMWSFYGVEARAANPSDSFWAEHLHAEDRERVQRRVAEVLGSNAARYNDEFRIVRDDGSCRWIEAAATVNRDADGKPTRMYGVNIDITERKSVEERIKSSEEQLRLVTDSLPALISYVDKDMRYGFVNRTYTEWFGQDYKGIIGKTIQEVAGEQAYQAVRPHIDKVMSGEAHSFETTLHYKTAGSRFVQVAYVPDKAADGTVDGFYAMISDLSELKFSQDQLQAAQERFRNVVGSFTDHAIFSTDGGGRIDSWNHGAANIFGYSQEEAIGQNAEILFTPEDRAKGVPADELKTARATGRASDERWHLRKDGSRFYASGMVTPLYFGRKLTGFAKIASDLTERKRAAEALQRAHDELEVRVAERTQELARTNTALMAEINERKSAERESIELLQRVVTTQEEERTRIARDLHDQLGQRLTALRLKIASLPEAFSDEDLLKNRTERLQELSKGIDSEISFLAWELRPGSLDELGLAEAIKAHMNEWSRHYEIAADFHTSGIGSDRLGQTVETHLYRIMQEALNNTAKHASATDVTILLEKMDRDAVLIVEDNGVGFDLRDGTRVERESGKGLGLAGMRERAALIGGELEIESSKGHGTTIFVRVPIERENGNA